MKIQIKLEVLFIKNDFNKIKMYFVCKTSIKKNISIVYQTGF